MATDSYLEIPLPETPPPVRRCKCCGKPCKNHNGPYGLNRCKGNDEQIERRKIIIEERNSRPKRHAKIDAIEKIKKMK